MAARIVVRPGERFNRLTVIKEIQPKIFPSGIKNRQFLCKCECGGFATAVLSGLLSGRRKSCGCTRVRYINDILTKHGMIDTPTYRTWIRMRERCNSPSADNFPRYGGRGISVCKEWDSFETFLADMGEKPDGMEIDRIDTNGNYCLENCRWVSRLENARNTRASKFWVVDGNRYESLSEAAQAYDVSRTTIRNWCEGYPKNRQGQALPPKPGCCSGLKYYNGVGK